MFFTIKQQFTTKNISNTLFFFLIVFTNNNNKKNSYTQSYIRIHLVNYVAPYQERERERWTEREREKVRRREGGGNT
jgi:hypothetical protein